MSSRTWRIGRRGTALAVIAIGVVAIGGTALAGHVTGAVQSYTGCLVPKDGVIVKVKQGDEPAGPCTGGMTQVHLSGGDVTEISVTGALTGGGDNGEVTIGLKPEFTLPSGCASGRVAEWDGTGWSCGIDDDTRYTAGTGLDLSAGAFSVEPAFQLPGKGCPSGQAATGFDAGGAIQCWTPPTPAPSAWVKRVAQANAPQLGAGALPPTVIELSLPAGTYAVHFTAAVSDDFHGNGELSVSCRIHAGSTIGRTAASTFDGTDQSIAFSDLATFTSPGKVDVACSSFSGSDHLEDLRLVAVAVGTVATQ